MAENKQTLQIQTLDGYPFTGVGGGSQTGRTTKGQNAAADLQQIEGTVTVTSAAGATSYYQLARVPSNVIIKSVEALTLGGGTITTAPNFSFTVGISDSTIDGTQPALQVVPSGLTTPPSNAFVANPGLTTTGLSGTASLFSNNAAGIAVGSWVDQTFAAGNFLPGTSMEQPLWQAAGYTQDPGGMFDIVALGTNASSFTAAYTLSARVRFSMPSG